MLKRLLEREGPHELEINKTFSKEPLASYPRNHCARLLDTIELPNDPPIMIHSFLRPFYKPHFQTCGEFVAFFRQISEVRIALFSRSRSYCSTPTRVSNLCIRIMSRIGNFLPLNIHWPLNMAIRDCASENIMFDPTKMYLKSFHPGRAKRHTRTWRPPRYLLIDIGLSRHYNPATGPPLEEPLRGGDKSAPEHKDLQTSCDPFPTDVYYLGNLVREQFIQVCTLVRS